jgi:hypothetical protein
MRSLLAPALFLSLALLAGCLGNQDAAVVPAAAPEPAAVGAPEGPMNQTTDFGWMAAVGVPTAGQSVQVLASNADEREVGPDAHMLTAEVEWACSTPSCDLHAYLCSPDEDPTPLAPCKLHAMGPSPLSLMAQDPAPGRWFVWVASDGPQADVSGTFTLTES